MDMYCKSSRVGDAEAAEHDIHEVGSLEADCDGGEPPLERAGPRADAPGSGMLAPCRGAPASAACAGRGQGLAIYPVEAGAGDESGASGSRAKVCTAGATFLYAVVPEVAGAAGYDDICLVVHEPAAAAGSTCSNADSDPKTCSESEHGGRGFRSRAPCGSQGS